jgi:hypothetical protein
MKFADKDLRCSTCGAEFVFSAGEQQFFLGRGFTNIPRHCKQCKAKRSGSGRVRPETQAPFRLDVLAAASDQLESFQSDAAKHVQRCSNAFF